MSSSPRSISFLIVLIALLVAGTAWIRFRNEPAEGVTTFSSCVAAGFPVQESYPRRCMTDDGRSFTEDIGNALELADTIAVTSPRPNALITSPLTVTGQARGTWFFEASFPVRLLDASGEVAATAVAAAQGEWMTDQLVPFTALLSFSGDGTTNGTLILERDNPSGLGDPETLRIPVQY